MNKRELRQSIIENINKIKNFYVLQELYKISDLQRRSSDDAEYAALTDSEREVCGIVNHITRCDDQRSLRNIRIVASVLTDSRKITVM